MIIAVNTIFPPGAFVYGLKDYIEESFSVIAAQNPQHQFIYFVDENENQKIAGAKNSNVVTIKIALKTPLRFQYFLNYKIPNLLKKYKADVFFSAGGVCSLRTKVQQCIIVSDLSFLQQPQFSTSNWRRFYKSNTPKFLNKAAAIVTAAQFLQQQIIDTYKITTDKITVAYSGINENFKPANEEEKEATKKKYTDGVEYFLYSGPIAPQIDLIQLLKAYSFFKKRQKSNMQLIVASATAASDTAFIKSLASFKYRAEVHVIENVAVENLATITAAAYAMVYPCAYDGMGTSLLQAMQSAIPIITGNNSANAATCGDAALYGNIADFNDIADKMMLVYKDEDKRNQIINKGRQQVTLYSWQKTAAVLAQVIAKFAN